MGEVYRARDTKLDREIALKILPQEMALDPDWRRRFEREARAIAALDHPNIVGIHSLEHADNRDFFTMELVQGTTLDGMLAGGGLPVPQLFQIGISVADAVSAAHEQGVTHRDLKPSNVMLDRAGRIRILDFGIAKMVETKSTAEDRTATMTQELTGPGVVLGTVPYMSPEQLQGKPIDHRTDIFSLGVMLYEMACGSAPFRGTSVATIASTILRDEPPPLGERRKDLPAEFVRIVGRCLRKDPERRFQTAKDVRNELEDALQTEGKGAGAATTDATTTVPVSKEHSFMLTADLVRSIVDRSPRMIGDRLTYLDNEVDSDVLLILMHGLGLDQRMFEGVLHNTAYRTIAPTLYGFGPRASFRPALSIRDHATLLRSLFADLQQRLRPRTVVLCGFSSGADQLLHMVSSEEGLGIGADGLIALGSNVSRETCNVSGIFARMPAGDPESVLPQLKTLVAGIDSMRLWLVLHDYLVKILLKFGADPHALIRYADEIMAPFDTDEPTQFDDWYRAAIAKLPFVRFVFADDEAPSIERVLSRHLDSNVLGDGYTEATIARAAVGHMELAEAELVLHYTQAALDSVRGRD